MSKIEREVKVVAIDCGKMNLKAKCGKEEIVYKNAYSLGSSEFVDKNTYNVTWEGQKYVVGNTGSKGMSGEGKESSVHILSALTAVTNFIEPGDYDDADIYVMYGESLNRYFNKEQRSTIKKKLETSHEIEVNNKKYNFRIKYVNVLPEGLGHILQDLSKYRGIQYVVDIGGATINFLTTNDGRPVEEMSRSFSLGMKNIRSNIQRELSVNNYGRVDESQIDKMLLTRLEQPKELQDIMDRAIEEQFEKLDTALFDACGIELRKILKFGNLTFIGGGAECLKDKIESEYKGAKVLENPMMANVRGFYEYGFLKYGVSLEKEDK